MPVHSLLAATRSHQYNKVVIRGNSRSGNARLGGVYVIENQVASLDPAQVRNRLPDPLTESVRGFAWTLKLPLVVLQGVHRGVGKLTGSTHFGLVRR